MTKMPTNKSSDGKDKFSSQVFETDISQSGGSSNSRQYELTPIANSKSVASELETRSTNSYREVAQSELTQVEKPNQDQTKSIFQKLKAKTAAALVGSAVMLPILGIGTATYYFGSQAVNKQAILARRSNYISLTETELAREQRLLAALLIGTGTTALLAGTIAALGTKRLFDSMSISNSDAEEAVIQVYGINKLGQSDRKQDILKAIVEEARNYLNCDRVMVYSLNQDRDGAIVAESVAPGYTKWLGITIKDPFEAKYLDKYRNGIRAINDIDRVEITPERRQQLEAMEVKASLVTPIVSEGNLFGLLVAHQCDRPREWQKGETEFFHQLAKKTGLALKNAQLLDDMVRIQTEAETERKWTNCFTDAIQHIRASIEQDDVLDISVEEVRKVLECDRVLVYSLHQDNRYGAVIAESVGAGYPRALNRTIEDPCFEARYLDKYRDGRVRAIDNIYEAGMSGCYIEQLESLEVKANLVTPILNEGKLFGLLVAHQCSEPRHWQDYEIRWVTQIATQVGFALDNAKLLQRSKEAGLPTQLLNNFSQGIVERANKSELLKIAVEQARKVIQLDRVIVYQFDDLNGNIVSESVAPGYPRAFNQIENPYLKREFIKEYRQGKTKAIADICRADLTMQDLEQFESLSVKAVIVVPILQGDRLFGLLIGHQCQQTRSWSQSEIDLFAGLALQLGLAIDRVDLKEQLDAVKNVRTNQTQRQLEQSDRESQLSSEQAQSIVRDKIERSTPNGLLAPYHDREIASTDTQTDEVITAQDAIAEVAKKVEALNQSQQNLHQMVNIINELKERIDRSSPAANELPQLPMEEITIEFSEAVLEPIASYDYDIDPTTGELVSEATPMSMNQFIEDISELSDKISQQSLIVTDSFQKLAEFAQQLSRKK